MGGPKPVYGAADDVRVSATSKAATTAAAAELEVKQPSATEVKVKVNGCQGNSQPGFASQPTIEKVAFTRTNKDYQIGQVLSYSRLRPALYCTCGCVCIVGK